jgi:hypothetical protein
MGSRASLDIVEKKNLLIVPGMEVRFLGFPAVTLVSCGE